MKCESGVRKETREGSERGGERKERVRVEREWSERGGGERQV